MPSRNNKRHPACKGVVLPLVSTSLVLLAVSAVACEQQLPEWHRGRTFSVSVTMDKRPIPRITVLLRPREAAGLGQVEAKTDDNGISTFNAVRPGRYYLEAARLGVDVGPGTVAVSDEGSSEPIYMEWPRRTQYTVSALAGQLQRHVFTKKKPIDGYVHPRLGPLSAAHLALSRIDSEREVGTTVTDQDGNFVYPSVEPGYYLLHVRENRLHELAYPIDDYLVIKIDPRSSIASLNLQVDWTSCGMTSKEIPTP